MGFQDALQQAIQATGGFNNNNNEKGHNPYNDLVNPALKITKTDNQKLLRVLPGVNQPFFIGFHRLPLLVKSASGKELTTNFTWRLGEGLDDSKELAQYSEWLTKGYTIPGMFGNDQKPMLRYYINVVEVAFNGDQPQYKLDSQGNLFVQMFEIPQTLFGEFAKLLQDPDMAPQGSGEESFTSAQSSYPVRVTRDDSGSFTSYSVNPYAHKPLGPLPQGWDKNLPDLHYQTTPVSEYDPNWYETMVKAVEALNGNGTLGGGDTSTPQPTQTQGFGQATNNNGFGQPQQQQGFNQQPQQPVQPTQQGFGQPTQPQQSFSQPEPEANVNSGLDNFGNQDPFVQQQPVQQQQQQNFSQPQPVQQQQPQVQQQPVQQQPVQQQQPQVQQTSQPQATNTESPSIDDLIAGMLQGE